MTTSLQPHPDDDDARPFAAHAHTPADLARLHAARRRGCALLYWSDSEGAIEIFELDEARAYALGRRPTASIVLDWDENVSRLHAELRCAGGGWIVEDFPRTKNPTRVNGARVAGRTPLHHEDVLRVGRTTLRFRDALGAAALEETRTEAQGALLPSCRLPVDRAILVELCRAHVADRRCPPVDNETIAATLHVSASSVASRLGVMYAECSIVGRRGEKRRLLVGRVLDEGLISRRDYG